MDNNFSQFDRAGNPWIDSREQAQMQAELAPTRGGRKFAIPKPDFREAGSPPARITDAALDREARQFMASWRGGTRTLCPHPEGPMHGRFVVFQRGANNMEIKNHVYVARREPGQA
jgi:hypothetical protein